MTFRSNKNPAFRSKFSEDIFNNKYKHEGAETWEELAYTLAEDVCGSFMPENEVKAVARAIAEMKFIPGGRYLYYAGRENKFFNNCFLLKAEEDSREDWANLSWKAESCLMTGGGIGVDYSAYREEGAPIKRTGGLASGPIPKMNMLNEIGRRVMQGGSRRSALYASLRHSHKDIWKFLSAKDWASQKVGNTGYTVADIKQQDFNFPATLDMTNISVNYDTEWLLNYMTTGDVGDVFRENVKQALKTAEPGFSFNFFDKEKETLRNAPVHPDTWVYTSTGYAQIRNIIDVPVSLWTGFQFASTKFTKTRSDDRVVKVTMTGRRSIICSLDHEFILSDGSRVKAEDLERHDLIMVSSPKRIGGKSVKEAYALAFIYGDGTFHSRYPRAEAAFVGVKESVIDKVLESGAECVVSRDKRGILRAYYKNNDIFRGRNKETFPDEVFCWNYESQLEFLAGLADADGNYSDKNLRIGCKHKSFLEGVVLLCDSLGFSANINKGSTGGYEGSSEESWMVVISGALSKIPTVRMRMDDIPRSKCFVVSVEDAGFSDVYCCDVGVEEHSFMANGVIISNCTEVTSEDDSDVCNLGSLNFGRIESIAELNELVALGTKFLICGTLKAQLPYAKIDEVRAKNRRLGLGIMGVHEWLIKRGYRYEVTPELHNWLSVYKGVSDDASIKFADSLGISRPVARRAIAPTGSIGILAGTSTGIEPIFAVAYKRRYLKNGTEWHYQYVVDSAAQELIDLYGVDPDKVESAIDLAADYERRIKFQADVQDYVDMSISSTINLPEWGSELNNESTVGKFTETLAKYAHRLRGFTCYPDGARGGQPLTSVPYSEARDKLGQEFMESVESHDVCDLRGGGTCGV